MVGGLKHLPSARSRERSRATVLVPWWTDKPHDWDTMMPGVVFFTGLGALGTFVRWRKKQAMSAVPEWTPPVPEWTPPAEATGNIAPIIEVEYKRLPN